MKFTKKGFTPLEILRGGISTNMKKTKKVLTGFTLIELLVVIAIIGILASVVLVSFPGATKKAKDARIISGIAQARTIMTYVCDSEGCDKFLKTHPDMTAIIADIDGQLPTAGASVITNTTGRDGNACISASMNDTNQGAYYCADRTGIAKYTTAQCLATGLCP